MPDSNTYYGGNIDGGPALIRDSSGKYVPITEPYTMNGRVTQPNVSYPAPAQLHSGISGGSSSSPASTPTPTPTPSGPEYKVTGNEIVGGKVVTNQYNESQAVPSRFTAYTENQAGQVLQYGTGEYLRNRANAEQAKANEFYSNPRNYMSVPGEAPRLMTNEYFINSAGIPISFKTGLPMNTEGSASQIQNNIDDSWFNKYETSKFGRGVNKFVDNADVAFTQLPGRAVNDVLNFFVKTNSKPLFLPEQTKGSVNANMKPSGTIKTTPPGELPGKLTNFGLTLVEATNPILAPFVFGPGIYKGVRTASNPKENVINRVFGGVSAGLNLAGLGLTEYGPIEKALGYGKNIKIDFLGYKVAPGAVEGTTKVIGDAKVTQDGLLWNKKWTVSNVEIEGTVKDVSNSVFGNPRVSPRLIQTGPDTFYVESISKGEMTPDNWWNRLVGGKTTKVQSGSATIGTKMPNYKIDLEIPPGLNIQLGDFERYNYEGATGIGNKAVPVVGENIKLGEQGIIGVSKSPGVTVNSLILFKNKEMFFRPYFDSRIGLLGNYEMPSLASIQKLSSQFGWLAPQIAKTALKPSLTSTLGSLVPKVINDIIPSVTAKSESAYTGLGTYERTNTGGPLSYSVRDFNVVNPDIKTKDISSNTFSFTPKVDYGANIVKPDVIIKTNSRGGVNETPNFFQTPLPNEDVIISPKDLQLPQQLPQFKQDIRQNQIQIPVQIVNTINPEPNPPVRFDLPKLQFTRMFNTEPKRMSSKRNTYIAELKRFGKFKPIGEAPTPQEALNIAKASARNTLGASIRVRTPKGFLSVAPSEEFGLSKSRKLSNVLVQRKTARLSSFGERAEIKRYNKSMKKIWGFK